MTPDRLRQIQELYHLAREHKPGQRTAFLAEACKDDDDLRREVESLLAAKSSGDCFLDEPIMRQAAGILASQPSRSEYRLAPGLQLGPYVIEARLGAGGMGEVYRAKDQRLHRTVALKVLPRRLADTPGLRQRLEREAKAISSLNHTHICTLYDIGREGDVDYLVMEFLEGDTLRRVIEAGPLPAPKATEIAIQVAAGLAAAHAAGLVHRDLKPDNIMVTRGGQVKILDFGLALRRRSAQGSATLELTDNGTVLGTAGYMSPEQVRGEVVDQRSDLFSFGVILYEMLVGRRAFLGGSSVEVMNAILKEEPPELPASVPLPLALIVRRCLEKQPELRFQSVADLGFALRMPIAALPRAAVTSVAAKHNPMLPWIAATVAVIVALLGWIRPWQPTAVAPSDVRFSILPPNGKALAPVGGLSVDTISPDGSAVLFRTAGENRFYVRKLNSLEAATLPEFPWGGNPFWGPGSQSIAYPVLTGALMRVRVPNGAPELIENAIRGGRGGTWGENGIILFASEGAVLYSVPAAGGKPSPVEVPGLAAGAYYNPQFLPGGEDFLFEYVPSDLEGAQVYLANFSDGKAVKPKRLLSNETAAAFTRAGGGRLIFVRNDNLYSQRLDLNGRRLLGDPELLQEHVASYAGPRNAYFSVSHTGTLVWRSGTAVVSQVIVFDRNGNHTGLAGIPAPVDTITLSPDESRLIASGEAGTWIMETSGPGRVGVRRGTLESPFFWSPDGSRLISIRGQKLVDRPVDDTGQVRELAEIPQFLTGSVLCGISPDGGKILLSSGGVFLFALDARATAEKFFGEAADFVVMSPDGKWILYSPNDELALYVRPVSGASLPKQIARSGHYATWRADGREIVYFDWDGLNISSVRVEGSGEALRFAAPQPLFSVARPIGTDSGSHPLSVNRDGSRIYFLQGSEQPDSGVIQVHIGAIR